jgi:predicted metal-dependent phosphoesterase TrpH
LIDLHLHTTASDGRLSPSALVARAAAAGLTTISVTDHDTVAGLAEARAAAAAAGIAFVDGIEITANERERDVHVLGYYFDPSHAALNRFLAAQRADRLRRVREMCGRLAAMGLVVSAEEIAGSASEASDRSIGRPAIADALVRRGHARDREDAFARLIGRGAPAFVPRHGAPAAQVVEIVRSAGGIASLAHPVLSGVDDLIPSLAAAGLAALEARHSDQGPEIESRYRALAAQLDLAISGGSDFHGDDTGNGAALGVVVLDAADFARLEARAGRAAGSG